MIAVDLETEPALKRCNGCRAGKPRTEFYHHKETADRLEPKCKACRSAGSRARRKVNGEEINRRERERYYATPEEERQARSRRSHADKEQRRAERRRYEARPEVKARKAFYQRTRRAIRRGVLVPKPCERCGGQDVQAHHDDYTDHLNVRWFCLACHAHHHRKGA